MPRERVSEPLVNTLIDQNAPLGTRKQKLFCFLESGDGEFARDGGKSLKKIFECFSAFEVIEKCLNGHSGTAKDQSSAENIRMLEDDSHGMIVAREMQRRREHPRRRLLGVD
jgi:hypothetical protein